MNVDDVIAFLDEKMKDREHGVRDAWRIVRGDLRRARRPSTELQAVEEPITAKQHFANVVEELKGRGERGGDGG